MRFVLLAGVVLGVLLRTVLPYLLRVAAGEVTFNLDYLRSAVFGLLLSFMATGVAVPMLDEALTWPAALWIGITTGYTSQTIVRHVESQGGTK